MLFNCQWLSVNKPADAPWPARDLLVAAMRYLQSRVEVGDVMTRNVVSVGPDTDLNEVARTMLERKIGGLPVVEDGRLVGIITESDIFKRFVELQS